MSVPVKPNTRPAYPNFSSGPCAKRPGWGPGVLSAALVGRSHRAKPARARINKLVTMTRDILGVPDDYLIAIVPASDTGAVEMILWSILGARGIDILAWESFGQGWVNDVVQQLRLKDVRVLEADYGCLPVLSKVDSDRDVVFTWNGTTSGVRVPNGDWISDERQGLTICDSTSAVFAMDLPWNKLDVVTFSWQKVLGGEAQHGMLIISPRTVQRLESYTPPWPLPKVFRLTKGGLLNRSIFEGSTINTPSMLCVEDAIDSLTWVKSVGGLSGVIGRSESNLSVISDWVSRTYWVGFLAEAVENQSSTSICLKIVADWFIELSDADQRIAANKIVTLLEEEEVAYDIGAYRDAPPGLRIWGGATVEKFDLQALCDWLDWAYSRIKPQYA